MGHGASYRPYYANAWVPPQPLGADVWRLSGNTNQSTGQGDYGSSRTRNFDAYAMVDAWRSYREDTAQFSDQRKDGALDPTASEFLSKDDWPSQFQLQPTPPFKPHESPRFSSVTAEAQLFRGLRNPGLSSSFNESRRNYSCTPTAKDAPIRSSCRDHPLPSIEPRADYIPEEHTGFYQFSRNNARQSTPRCTPQRTASPPIAPEASEAYLTQARLPPTRRSTPQKCLVILDLNGTCIARLNLLEPKVFKARPGIHKFFDYLFEHHVVMVFTSMQHKNAAVIVDSLFTSSQRKKLAAFWARDKLGLTSEQLHAKTQTYKNLIPIWLDKTIQSTYPADQGGWCWDQSNTVLIDDSHLKAVSHPYNLLLVPEFAKKIAAKEKLHPIVERSEATILQSLISKLEELKYQTDVSRLILQWETGVVRMPFEPQNGLLVEEKKKMEVESAEPVQLLTPTSTVDPLSEDSQDDEIHLRLSAQLKASAEYKDRWERDVSEVPDTVWTDLLNGTQTKL